MNRQETPRRVARRELGSTARVGRAGRRGDAWRTRSSGRRSKCIGTWGRVTWSQSMKTPWRSSCGCGASHSSGRCRSPSRYKGHAVGEGRLRLPGGRPSHRRTQGRGGTRPRPPRPVLSYLRTTGLHLGLLINFNVRILKDGLKPHHPLPTLTPPPAFRRPLRLGGSLFFPECTFMARPRTTSTSAASTPSAPCRWTPSRPPTPATPARRWPGAGGLHALAGVPPVRPAGPDLAEPRPLRPLGRPCVDAALLAAAPRRREVGQQGYEILGDAVGDARRHQEVPPARQQDPRPPRIPLDLAASRPPPARSARAWPPRVGMAIGGKWLAAPLQHARASTLFDFDVYALCGDGDMMEGVSSEAASLAGHLKLSNLCWIYDNNRITIEGSTDLAFTEDVAARFVAYGWNVTPRRRRQRHRRARTAPSRRSRRPKDRPTFILVDSHIGYGSTQAGHAQGPRRAAGRRRDRRVQGEVRLARPRSSTSPTASTTTSRTASASAARSSATPGSPRSTSTRPSTPTKADAALRGCSTASSPTAGTRTSRPSPPTPRAWPAATPSAKVLNAIAKNVPWLIGGSADLDAVDQDPPSTKDAGDFEAGPTAAGTSTSASASTRWRADPQRPGPDQGPPATARASSSSATTPARRSASAAIMEIPDDPRLHPRLDRRRRGRPDPPARRAPRQPPRDPRPGRASARPTPTRCVEAWQVIMKLSHEPACLVLTRQDLPTLDRTKYAPASGWPRAPTSWPTPTDGKPDVLLIGTGSEVSLCVDAYETLKAEGIKARVVSMPSGTSSSTRPRNTGDSVIPPGRHRPRLRSSRPATFGWERYTGLTGRRIGMHTFGRLGPAQGAPGEVRVHAREGRRRGQERRSSPWSEAAERPEGGERLPSDADHAELERPATEMPPRRPRIHDASPSIAPSNSSTTATSSASAPAGRRPSSSGPSGRAGQGRPEVRGVPTSEATRPSWPAARHPADASTRSTRSTWPSTAPTRSTRTWTLSRAGAGPASARRSSRRRRRGSSSWWQEKVVDTLGEGGVLPVEVVPFALGFCRRKLTPSACSPDPGATHGDLYITDNGNPILDCRIAALNDPAGLEQAILAIPASSAPGLFLGMADVGDRRRRQFGAGFAAATGLSSARPRLP